MGLFFARNKPAEPKTEERPPAVPAKCAHADREVDARRTMGGGRVQVIKCQTCGYVGEA